MSSHRSPSIGIEVPMLAGAAAFLGFCFWIAQISGASLASVMKSAFGLIGLAVVVGGALWWLKDYFFIGAAFYLVVGALCGRCWTASPQAATREKTGR
ncbi:hypothetical protein [Paraburkholderia sp. HC6.4b]|uniref:hypothetical protein n=2 Tax=unclassified Paraburkholderia TaxID=2615204 RepID=UPI00161C9EAE|nr:hypothetical protein [Paraburkholderia sp. HC6.4b]